MQIRTGAALALATTALLYVPTGTATADPSKASAECTVIGTSGPDVLHGTNRDDYICGLGGDDKILGRDGDDVLQGGGGDDLLVGGSGDDVLGGGRGDDTLNGLDDATAVDRLRCGRGNDTAKADPPDIPRPKCEHVVRDDAPTDVMLTPGSVAENQPVGTSAGTLAATDPDTGDTHTFTLVAGTGSADNASFTVVGTTLRTAVSLDHEVTPTRSVRVRATDAAGLTFEKALTITVTDADDPPVAVDDTETVTEDAAATPIDVLANDTDTDGGPKSVASVTQPAHGTVAVTGGGSGLTYQPDPNHCNGGSPTDDFTYTLNGGDVGAVQVTVTCVNDLADAVNDSASVAEDAAATVIDVLANDTDVEGDPISVTGVTQPADGTATLSSGVVRYTPNPDFCNTPPPFDTFTYTVSGGDSATVSVTVTCQNDAPVAVDDDRTTPEDIDLVVTGASLVANDTDVENDALVVTAVSNPTGGTVNLTSGSVTFSPTADLCGNDAGSFTYTVGDGNGGTDTGAVSVDITCANDDPVANDDTETVAEDSAATSFAVLANDTDVEGDAITVTGVSQPTNGAVTFTASNVSYTPNLNYCNTPTPPFDTFTYTVNGGDSAAVSVEVTCANDAPSVDLDSTSGGTGAASVFTESDPHTGTGVLIAPNAQVADTDDANLDSATITLTSRPDGDAFESLSATIPSGSAITGGTYDPATGVLAYTGNASKADYAALLASVRYDNTKNPPNAANRTITVVVNDGSADSASETATVQVVPLNVPPDLDLDTTEAGNDSESTFTEGGTAAAVAPSPAITDTDDADLEGATATLTARPDGNSAESLSYTIPGGSGISAVGGGYDPATGTLAFTGTASKADYEALLGSIGYANTSDTPTTTDRTVTVQVSDGLDDSSVRTATVSVAATNDAPVNTVPGAQTATEDTSKVITGISVADPDDASLTVTVSVTNGTLTLASTTGLSFVTGDGTADATTEFSGTKADLNTALASLTYDPTPNHDGSATLTVLTEDATLSDTDNVAISVAAVNDAPVNTVPGAQTVDEDVDLVFSGGNLISVADVDNANLSIEVTVTNGTFTLSGAAGLTVTGNGTGSVTASGPKADLNAALSGATYRGAPNYNGPAQLSIDTTDSGGESDLDTVAITVNPVNDAPVADNENLTGPDSAIGNTRLVVNDPTDGAPADPAGPQKSITGDILAGDTDVDGPGPLTVTAGTISTADGGTVDLEADGDFVYTPDDDAACGDGSDSFDYTLEDSGTPELTDTGTVTIQVLECVWYVDASAPAGGDGRSHAPYNNLTPLNGAGGAGDVDNDSDYLFLYGGGSFSTGIVLEPVQKLYGEPQGLAVGGTQLVAPGGTNPNIYQAGVGATGITLANTVDIRGVDAGQPGTGSAFGIRGIGIPTATVGSNVNIRGNGIGFGLQGNANGNIDVDATIAGNNGAAVSVQQRTGGTVSIDGPVTAAGPNTTVEAVNNTGATVAVNGRLDLSGGSAAVPALDLRGGGTVIAANSANTITGFTGTGVNLDGVTLGTGGVFVDILSSAGGGAQNGVLVTNVSGAAVTVDDGTLTTSVRGVDVDGGSADVIVDATLDPTGGRSVEVTGRTGGTVDLNGPVNEDATGINLDNNTGATIRFDGGLNAAVTTADTALDATGGGLVTVTDPAGLAVNTLSSASGTALNVVNTTIHEDDLTFQSISSGNNSLAADPASGIVLNNTGSLGGLTVTGNGGTCTSAGTCTGGVIQNVGVGVSLTNTRNVSIDRMLIQNTSDSGVKGTTTTNFSFTNGRVDNSGTGLGAETSNIAFNNTALGTENNLSGTVTITGNTLTSAYYHGIDVFNFNGTIANATIANNTITSTTSTATSKGSGIRFVAFGSASTIANVTKATIANNVVSNFPSAAGIQAQGGNGNLAGPAGVFGTAGSGTNNIAITGNRVSGASVVNRLGTFAIAASVNGRGQGSFDISNNGTPANPVGNSIGAAISVSSFGFANVTANVNNNVIVANNQLGSPGIGAGTSQTVSSAETPTLTVSITNNSISQTDGNGILVTARDATGQVNASIKDNTVAAPLSGSRNGIRVDAGNAVSVDDEVCVDVAGNTSAGSGLAPEAIGLRKHGTTTTVNDFGVEGMAATSSPGVEAFVSGLQDVGSQSTLLISATSGFSNCSSAP